MTHPCIVTCKSFPQWQRLSDLLRTVANGCEHRSNGSRTRLYPQTPRVKREPFATHSGRKNRLARHVEPPQVQPQTSTLEGLVVGGFEADPRWSFLGFDALHHIIRHRFVLLELHAWQARGGWALRVSPPHPTWTWTWHGFCGVWAPRGTDFPLQTTGFDGPC